MDRPARLLAAGLLLAGAALTIAARTYTWHSIAQTGFTAPSGSLDDALIALAVAVALCAIAVSFSDRAGARGRAGFVATVLAGVLVAALLTLGDVGDLPDTGAWLAGAALAALLAAVAVLGLRGAVARLTAVAVACAVAGVMVAVPPSGHHPQEITVIR